MVLGEMIFRKKYIELQIDELRHHIIYDEDVPNMNELLSRLYELEDQNQKYKMLIDKSNRQTTIKIGKSLVSIDTAIELRKNTDNKIDILTNLIKANKQSLDIFNLMSQRNKLIEEYVLITNAIRISDWSTNVD
jgi:hypothetical protein